MHDKNGPRKDKLGQVPGVEVGATEGLQGIEGDHRSQGHQRFVAGGQPHLVDHGLVVETPPRAIPANGLLGELGDAIVGLLKVAGKLGGLQNRRCRVGGAVVGDLVAAGQNILQDCTARVEVVGNHKEGGPHGVLGGAVVAIEGGQNKASRGVVAIARRRHIIDGESHQGCLGRGVEQRIRKHPGDLGEQLVVGRSHGGDCPLELGG